MTALPLALALLLSPVAAPPDALAAPSGIAAAGTAPTAPARGVPPLDPLRVVEGFDPPATVYGAGHRGVDLAGRPGQRVVTALPGRVTLAGSVAGTAVVVVDHGRVRTTYQPVRATVQVGTEVAAGDVLGELVTGGSHCSPAACLHWGLKQDEEYLDPMSLLGPRRVRLLPLPG